MIDTSDRIKPNDCSITTFLDDLQRKKYQIPTFQRDVVWDRDHVKKLWDSIYRFYPIGSILIWKTDIHLQKHRSIGGHVIEPDDVQDHFQYILDGQQRTTSLLTSIQGGKIEGQEDFDPTIYVDLTVKPSEEPEDDSYRSRFLFWADIDDQGIVPHRNNERKKRHDAGLVVRLRDILQQYGIIDRRLHEMGADYDDPRLENLRRMKQVLENYRIALIELKGIQVPEVCQIFERINQQGKPLNIFDIIVAKTFVPPVLNNGEKGFYLRDYFEALRSAAPGSRFLQEIDDLTILHMIASIILDRKPGAGVLNITDRYLNNLTSQMLREVWPDAAKAILRTFDFLENHLHLKGPALIPYRYFYMVYAAYLYQNASPDLKQMKRHFWYTSFHNEDMLNNTTELRQHIKLFHAARDGGELPLERFFIDRERLRSASYNSRSRLSRAVLSLYANHEPRDWDAPDRKVLADVYYTLTDKPNLHHIFPTGHMRKFSGKLKPTQNSLMNIAYLTQITNLRISDKNPVDYLRDRAAFNQSGRAGAARGRIAPAARPAPGMDQPRQPAGESAGHLRRSPRRPRHRDAPPKNPRRHLRRRGYPGQGAGIEPSHGPVARSDGREPGD